jgi:hypothetical protein
VSTSVLRSAALAIVACLICAVGTQAASDSNLVAAFDKLADPVFVATGARIIVNDTIPQHDFVLIIDSALYYPFEKVLIGADSLSFGGYFEGRARIRFQPPLAVEQNQLGRFFDSTGIDRPVTSALVMCDGKTAGSLAGHGLAVADQISRHSHNVEKELLDLISGDERKEYLFDLLKNLAFPRKQGYLMVTTSIANTGNVMYIFNPYEREEVSLLKQYNRPGYDGVLEIICSYSIYAADQSPNTDGLDKDALKVEHYDLDGAITRGGDYYGAAKVRFNVTLAPTQMVMFSLLDSMVIDSILDTAGQKISHLTFDKKSHQDGGVYVILPRPLQSGETVTLTFCYHGDVAQKNLGEFFVEAGAYWYPRFGFRQRATFAMRFRSPYDYGFCATGTELERRVVKETLFTRFEVTNPTSNVSFNIGLFKKYTFGDTTANPVDVYFSEDLHRLMASALVEEMVTTGNHMERQVGNDVVNAISLFSHLFGAPPKGRVTVSEILASYGEAFPGFVHLGFPTWLNTDSWGYDRMFRAHEVAHQWWGASVGYGTYHDQWLSEGFADYSCLMYLQAVAGNKMFGDRLNEYRNDIFSANGDKVSEKFEGGPISLGYRNSTSETRGYFTLIVYKKGAYVLHMLRNLLLDLHTMNEDRFLGLMREFYSTYRDSNVTTATFRQLVEKHVGQDMGWFFDQWVYHSYLPTYDFSYEILPGDSGTVKAMLHIVQKNVPDSFTMLVPLEIQFASSKAYIRLLIDRPKVDLPLDLPSKPTKMTLNPFNSVLAKVNQ